MLKQRIITASLLIPLTLLILFFLPPPAFLMLTGLITIAAGWEWATLCGFKTWLAKLIYLGMLALIFIWALYVPAAYIFYAAAVWWLLATLLVVFYARGAKLGRSKMIGSAMGVFVLLPCWVAINFIRNQEPNGLALLLFLFVLIWGADSAAFFVGKKWGKTKLAKKVSPGKSVEGVLGAAIFAMIFSLAVFYACEVPAQQWLWGVILSIVTVLFSVVGDLFESVMKRIAGVKDSGKLFPGHGGLLDRIDSLTTAAPIYALGSLLIGAYF